MRAVVTFANGEQSVYSQEYGTWQTPGELFASLTAQAASATDADLRACGIDRAGIAPVSVRLAGSWYGVSSFIDRYRAPGSPTGTQVVAKMRALTTTAVEG